MLGQDIGPWYKAKIGPAGLLQGLVRGQRGGALRMRSDDDAIPGTRPRSVKLLLLLFLLRHPTTRAPLPCSSFLFPRPSPLAHSFEKQARSSTPPGVASVLERPSGRERKVKELRTIGHCRRSSRYIGSPPTAAAAVATAPRRQGKQDCSLTACPMGETLLCQVYEFQERHGLTSIVTARPEP